MKDQKTPEGIPKIYLISNGNDGKEILNYLVSIGGKNVFYGWARADKYRWTSKDISKGNYAYIDSEGEIRISEYKPSDEYKLGKITTSPPKEKKPKPPKITKAMQEYAQTISEGKDREIEELRKKNHKYRVALDTISDPIAHLHSEAIFSGGQVDGTNAVYLSNSADYLKNIAREAIK